MQKNESIVLSVAGLALAVTAATASAAFTPPLASVIDPTGGQDVDQDAFPRITSPLNVIQDWTGFVRANGITAAGEIATFTDPNLPDIRFVGSNNIAGSALSTTTTGTSSGSGLQLRSSTGSTLRTFTFTIDFGDFDGTTFNAAVNSVANAAFTVSEIGLTESVSVSYFDGATLLTTQNAAGNTEGTSTAVPLSANDVYFGYTAATGQAIDRIVINFTTVATSGAPTGAFDDLGFSNVPEPTLLGVAGLGAMALLRRRK